MSAAAVQVGTPADSAKAEQPEQMAQAATQWAWRSLKAIGLSTGAPSYSSVSGFQQVDGGESGAEGSSRATSARIFEYSPDGSMFAAAMEGFTRIVNTSEASTSSVVHDLPAKQVVDLRFSPKGTYLSTWERPPRAEDGKTVNGALNLRIWNTRTGEEVSAYERKSQSGCFFQFTSDEKYCVRQVSTELQVYESATMKQQGVVGRLKLDGMTSFELGPGEHPSIAVFCGEKKSQPASVKIYLLSSLIPTPKEPPTPLSQKTFFKADRIQMKWNKSGTALLFMTSTDVDNSGKSYYGETNLYLMTARGDFDCRVALDKEGPIHDFDWSPNSREFIVLYGFMPAKAVLFSYKVNIIADLGVFPRNFVAFNPQGRLFCLAGFGNLSGTVDVWDRENLDKGKLYSFDASNSSVCEWSPDGHFLLTATLSPRLRVENGVKIWHCTSALVHVDMVDELYQAAWRPSLNAELTAFPAQIPKAPRPSEKAAAFLAAKPVSTKPAGAYRPPGARGQATPDIFRREDEGGSGASTPRRDIPGAGGEGGSYVAPGSRPGQRRAVPGAAAPGASASTGSAKSQNKRKTKKGAATPAAPEGPSAAVDVSNGIAALSLINGNGSAAPTGGASAVPAAAGAAEVGGSGSGVEKKMRNLNKKLKAIQELKEKQARGEKLEQTQLSKIAGEADIKAELAALEA